MKKIILSVAVCTIALVACNKKQLNTIAPEVSSTNVVEAPITNQRIGNSGDYTTYYDNGGTDYGCKGSPANCYGANAIAHPDRPSFNNLFAVLNSNNPIAISNVITNHMPVLEKYIDRSDLDNVLNGSFGINVKGTNKNDTRYIMFTAVQKGSIEMVYSIKPY